MLFDLALLMVTYYTPLFPNGKHSWKRGIGKGSMILKRLDDPIIRNVANLEGEKNKNSGEGDK